MFVYVLLKMFSATVTALLTLTAPKALGEGQQEVGVIWMVCFFCFWFFFFFLKRRMKQVGTVMCSGGDATMVNVLLAQMLCSENTDRRLKGRLAGSTLISCSRKGKPTPHAGSGAPQVTAGLLLMTYSHHQPEAPMLGTGRQTEGLGDIPA